MRRDGEQTLKVEASGQTVPSLSAIVIYTNPMSTKARTEKRGVGCVNSEQAQQEAEPGLQNFNNALTEISSRQQVIRPRWKEIKLVKLWGGELPSKEGKYCLITSRLEGSRFFGCILSFINRRIIP